MSINELSVIIPVTDRSSGLMELHERYAAALSKAEVSRKEFIYVVTPPFMEIAAKLKTQSNPDTPITIVELARNFGDAIAIKLGASQANYELLLILPPYEQVSPEGIPTLLREIEDVDVVCVRRWPRLDSRFKQLPSRVLGLLIRTFSDAPYGDAACTVVLCRRSVLEELNLYGEFHRFLSLFAHDQGFFVRIVDLPQSSRKDHYYSSVFVYLRRLLDVFAILFLTKFNRRHAARIEFLGDIVLRCGAEKIGLAVAVDVADLDARAELVAGDSGRADQTDRGGLRRDRRSAFDGAGEQVDRAGVGRTHDVDLVRAHDEVRLAVPVQVAGAHARAERVARTVSDDLDVGLAAVEAVELEGLRATEEHEDRACAHPAARVSRRRDEQIAEAVAVARRWWAEPASRRRSPGAGGPLQRRSAPPRRHGSRQRRPGRRR